MKISNAIPLAGACFAFGYLQSRTDMGNSHPGWFLVAVVVTVMTLGFASEAQ